MLSTTRLTTIAMTLATAAFLTGCGTPPPAAVRDVYPTTEVRHTPELNATGKAELGESMVTKEYVSRIRGIHVAAAVAESVNPPGTTTILPGELELIATRPEGEYYQGAATYSMLGQAVPASDRAGVFVPSDKTKPAVIYHFALGYHYGTRPVTYTSKEIVRFTSESFRRELIYSGVSQNTVTVVYREFKDNLARPAFTQELKYDLGQSRVIGYKGARFEVLDAGNTAITYKVLSLLQ
jgi:hypothetical protein